MKFIEKNAAKIKLQSAKHLKADRELLKKKDPGAKALLKTSGDKLREDKEILWDLLEVATVAEIEKNRGTHKEAPKKEEKPKEPEKPKKEETKQPAPEPQAQKKSTQQKKSSTKKRSTQTSTGKTSATRTSKKPR